MRYCWEREAVISWFLVEVQTRLNVAEGETPNCWLVASLENELLCNSKWEVVYITKPPLPKVVMVVRFTGNFSSNAKDCLDRTNKQLVAVCSVVEGGRWKSHSHQLMLPVWVQRRTQIPITAHKILVHLTSPLTVQTKTKLDGSYPLNSPVARSSCHALPAGHMHLHTLPIPWFKEALTMCLQGSHVLLSCISHQRVLCLWGTRTRGLVKAKLVINTLEFSSVLRSRTGFCQDKCWHIPQ